MFTVPKSQQKLPGVSLDLMQAAKLVFFISTQRIRGGIVRDRERRRRRREKREGREKWMEREEGCPFQYLVHDING